jgi:hypothetical protein
LEFLRNEVASLPQPASICDPFLAGFACDSLQPNELKPERLKRMQGIGSSSIQAPIRSNAGFQPDPTPKKEEIETDSRKSSIKSVSFPLVQGFSSLYLDFFRFES